MDTSLILKWISNNSYCCDDIGYGDGSGNSIGYGYDDSSGDSISDGSNDCYGNGFGCGYGNGSGSVNGSGFGCGYMDRATIKKYNDLDVFPIDNIPTIITNIKDNIAKGYILREDLTLEKTFVVKGNGYFAHGKTIREAIQSLEIKIFENIDVKEKIEIFKKTFNKTDKYKGTLFFDWHNKLTGSCLQGREEFIKSKGLSLEDEYTVNEFLQYIKGYYGWEHIKELEDFYKENK